MHREILSRLSVSEIMPFFVQRVLYYESRFSCFIDKSNILHDDKEVMVT